MPSTDNKADTSGRVARPGRRPARKPERLAAPWWQMRTRFVPQRKTLPPIYIHTPGYSFMHSGVRCLHLLCHHLNRAGYETYLHQYSHPAADSGLNLPVVRWSTIKWHRLMRRDPIVIYPEITRGNPLGIRRVIRYLLNRPGLFAPGVEKTYGADDYFIHFAEEFVPDGWRSASLFIPLIDTAVFHPPAQRENREGYVVYASRAQPDPATFPSWLAPIEWISKAKPRAPEECAALYRKARALVTYERSAAIFEALHCDCPVICIKSEWLQESPHYEKFAGKGLVWGWDRERLAQARLEAPEIRSSFLQFDETMERRLVDVIDDAFRHFQHCAVSACDA